MASVSGESPALCIFQSITLVIVHSAPFGCYSSVFSACEEMALGKLVERAQLVYATANSVCQAEAHTLGPVEDVSLWAYNSGAHLQC